MRCCPDEAGVDGRGEVEAEDEKRKKRKRLNMYTIHGLSEIYTADLDVDNDNITVHHIQSLKRLRFAYPSFLVCFLAMNLPLSLCVSCILGRSCQFFAYAISVIFFLCSDTFQFV